MTPEEVTTAISTAATAVGIDKPEQLAGLLTGSFTISKTIAAVGLTADQLAELLTKGQLPAKVADLEKQIRAKESERSAADQVFREEISALQQQIAALKSA